MTVSNSAATPSVARTRHVLSNGFVVLLAPHPGAVVSVQTWYAVGSADDPPHQTGAAHLLEHMMFKGAARFQKGDIDRATLLRGGANNAFTNCDATVYQFDLPAGHLELALDIEADRMHDLRLEEAEFEAERNVVLEEIKENLEYPESRLLVAADTATFGGHGYAHPVMGHRRDVEALTLDDIRAHYDTWYRPERAAIVIAGAMDVERTLEAVATRFGGKDANAQPTAPARERHRTPFNVSAQRIERRDPVGVARLYLQFPGVTSRDPRAVALDALEHILASGRNSRLFRSLVQDAGLASAVAVENDPRLDAGVFWIEITATEGTAPAAIERAIAHELEQLAELGPRVTELQRTQHALRVEEIFGRETPWDVAEFLGDAEMATGFEAYDSYLADVAALTPADIRTVCREIADIARATIAWSLPESD